MISEKKLNELIQEGEEEIRELEEDGIHEQLKHNEYYVIQVSLLKLLKFIRDSDE